MFKKASVVLAVFFLSLFLLRPNLLKPTKSTVVIKDIVIYVHVAKTEEEITRGLGGVKKLEEDEGMYFLMGKKDYYNFWMKNMLIPIDIIWINGRKIVDITKRAPVENNNNLTIYSPKSPSDGVLEVNAGFSDKHNIKVGDTINVNF